MGCRPRTRPQRRHERHPSGLHARHAPINENADQDPAFEQALANTDSIIGNNHSSDYVGTFVQQYRALNPGADYSVVFNSIVKQGQSDKDVASVLKSEVKDRVNNSATNVLRSRIDAYGVVSPNIQVLSGQRRPDSSRAPRR